MSADPFTRFRLDDRLALATSAGGAMSGAVVAVDGAHLVSSL